MEVLSNISWTPNLPAMFKTKNGYDVRPYLPLIMYQNNNINLQAGAPGAALHPQHPGSRLWLR